MRNRMYAVLMLLVVTVFAFTLFGCAKQEGPKEEDAIKVIQATVEADLKGATLKLPIVILEKGAKLSTGEWPIKVEYSVTAADGSVKKEVVTYKLSPTVNDMGANTWLATVAK
ncbi:MAG: hypothetical protein HZB31_10800 [Nitrospirae bacterium]|nr:hypothetical protein [Nitrospirota bacterium]